jgi:N-acyl-D-aspartate/D-glutamate deacylase
MFDLLIENGFIVDGSGQPGFTGDVGITHDRVVAMGELGSSEAREIIDATGLVVAPGFVDIHTHSDLTLIVDPRAESQIRQGVTTEVIGQCGASLAPCTDESRKARLLSMGAPDHGTWKSYAELLDVMDQAGIATNVVGMVGHGALRDVVMGPDAPRPATGEEIEAMVRLLEQALEEGAFGLTTGLEYHPGKEAGYDELAALCRATARVDGLYATHTRNRDRRYFVGFGEALDVARDSGVRLQISHINPKYGRPTHAMRNTLEMIEWTREEGLDVAMDAMPTNWNHTGLRALLPSWAFGLPGDELMALLGSSEGREKLKVNPLPIWLLAVEERWDKIRLLSSRVNVDYLGWTIEEIARDRETTGWDAVFDLLREEGERLGSVMVTSEAFAEEDNRLAMDDSRCAVASDTMALANDGVLAGVKLGFLGYNWVARYIAHYLRDEQVLTLEEGLRRISSLPASRVGLTDRGRLAPGAAADVTIFDLEKVKDNSTIPDPNVYSDGFEHVIVNGVQAFRRSQRTTDHAGRVLRRKT